MAEKIKPAIFYIIFFLFVLAIGTFAKDYDYDFWARLIAGMGFAQTGYVIKQDFLSYTPTHIWFDHEWGSGVIFYLTQHFFSAAGILILQAFIIFLIFFFITKIVELREVKTTSAYNFLFYYFSFMSINYILNDPIRCQLFSFLFFTVYLYILERARKGTGKDFELFILIPLIMLIWNNLHGGCVSGVGLILLYIVGEFFNKKPIKKYIYTLIFSLLVLPLNPWGLGYLQFLFKANTMQRTDIAEWLGLFSPFIIENVKKYLLFEIYTLILILTQIYVIIKQLIQKSFTFDATKFLVIGVTLLLGIWHVKLVPLALISMVCFLYDDFYTVFNSLTRNLFEKISKPKEIIVYSVILIFSLVNIKLNSFPPLVSGSRYPLRAIEFINGNNIKGNLLISFGFGSYASYKLYPQNKIFMDGRYEEVYYDYMIPLLRTFSLAKPGWEDILAKYPTDILLVEKFYPIFDALKKNNNWDLIYDDNFFAVFVKHKKNHPKYKKPSQDIKYYRKTLFETNIKFDKKI